MKLYVNDPYAHVEHFDGEAEGKNDAQSSRNDDPILQVLIEKFIQRELILIFLFVNC